MAITPTYSWPTPDDTDLVRDGAEAIRDLALAIESTVSALGSKRIEAFTASGTWTVPTGVTYAIAHMIGGGGGIGSASSGNGGASSVAFSGGTVSATGGNGVNIANLNNNARATAAQANSGQGGRYFAQGDNVGIDFQAGAAQMAFNGNQIVAADTVTPAASITVTVGAGGAAGTGGAAGGSGYVYIEYYE
jgi:hypothetical protein